MKRTISLMLSLAILLPLLTACRPEGADDASSAPEEPSAEPTQTVQVDARELADLICAALASGEAADLERRYVDEDAQWLSTYIESAYGLQDPWEDAAAIRATGASAFEIAVLVMPDEDAAARTADALAEYLIARERDFTGCAPAQAKLAADAALAQEGRYVGLFIVEDSACAETLFTQYVRTGIAPEWPETALSPEPVAPTSAIDGLTWPDRVEFDPPDRDDMSIYDTSAIRAAWEAGDPAGLSEGDKAVYDAAGEILDEILREGMTDLEREAAIYYWLVNNVDYDWRRQDVMAETSRAAFQPYGGLVDRSAVCLGYATAFQLLCDLAEVECITVVGACVSSTGDHAWNMVRIDGEWYCVDVAWDASARENQAEFGDFGEPSDWCYFNITSEEMAATDHQWDYANTPEATAADHGQS